MASSNKIQGSNPIPVVHSKPFVQVFNVLCLRLVCIDGKEKVNPENAYFNRDQCIIIMTHHLI